MNESSVSPSKKTSAWRCHQPRLRPGNPHGRGRFLAREPLTLSGIGSALEIYQLRGGVDELNILKQDGDCLRRWRYRRHVRGRARTLLACERVALNFLQR